MDAAEFRKQCYRLIDWAAADCPDKTTDRPAEPTAESGPIKSRLPDRAPETPEEMNRILEDFRELIVPDLLQRNRSFSSGHFQADTSYPGILGGLAEAVVNAGALDQAVAPAATGLEETVLGWLKQACGLPDHFKGVIHEAAFAGTVAAVLAARERATNGRAGRTGLTGGAASLTAYASAEAYAALEKAVMVAGLGRDNLRLIPGVAGSGLDSGRLGRGDRGRSAGRSQTDHRRRLGRL